MEERLAYVLEQLVLASSNFKNALAIHEESLDATIIDTVHTGQAQKFEFTVELFWKTIKVFLLEQHGFDIASPKGVMKKYFELARRTRRVEGRKRGAEIGSPAPDDHFSIILR